MRTPSALSGFVWTRGLEHRRGEAQARDRIPPIGASPSTIRCQLAPDTHSAARALHNLPGGVGQRAGTHVEIVSGVLGHQHELSASWIALHSSCRAHLRPQRSKAGGVGGPSAIPQRSHGSEEEAHGAHVSVFQAENAVGAEAEEEEGPRRCRASGRGRQPTSEVLQGRRRRLRHVRRAPKLVGFSAGLLSRHAYDRGMCACLDVRLLHTHRWAEHHQGIGCKLPCASRMVVDCPLCGALPSDWSRSTLGRGLVGIGFCVCVCVRVSLLLEGGLVRPTWRSRPLCAVVWP